MSSAVQTLREVGRMPGGVPAPSTQHSRLFPSLFEERAPDRHLTVLDAGPAMPETIRFMGQFKSRLHVTDLYAEALVRDRQGDLSEQELKEEFQDILKLPVGTMLDICLFWDFLNYLNRPALRALSAALRPYVHPGTLGHGFSVLNVNTPLRNQQYGIMRPDTLSLRPARRVQLEYYPHSHEELNAYFECFEVERGWLLPDGRLEILLQAQV